MEITSLRERISELEEKIGESGELENRFKEKTDALLRANTELKAEILKRKQIESLLEERLRFEKLLSEISAAFINLPADEVDIRIEYCLRRIVELLRIDRCTMGKFTKDQDDLRLTHSFAAADLKTFPLVETRDRFPWIVGTLLRGEVVKFSGIKDFPDEAVLEKQFMLEKGTGSGLIIPLKAAQTMVGVVFFESIRSPRSWPDDLVSRLQLIGGVFANALLRQRSEQELKKSEERFRMLAENARDMIFRISLPEGRFEYVSPASLSITGYSPDEICLFRNLPEFVDKIMHSEFREEFTQVWREFLDGVVRHDYEFKIIQKSGEELWVHQRSVMIGDESGRPAAVEGFVTDISHRKNLEKKIIDMQKMQAIGTLAGGIAHDFNNILGVVIGNAEMIEMFDLPNESPVRKRLKKIIDAGYRAKELVNQILTFAQMNEHKKHPFRFQPVIRDAVKFLRSTLPVTIKIKLDIGSPETVINGDPVQIQRILINLGMNAGQAMTDHQGEIAFSMREVLYSDLAPDDQTNLLPGIYALLSVRDTGRGMEQSLMRRIFEPYFTTHRFGDGIGLGLAVVHGIVKDHQGKISVESEPGAGSRFKVFLPIMDKL